MSLILKGLRCIVPIMRMILRLVVCVVLMGICIPVQAQESSGTTTEKWRCFGTYDFDKKTAVVKLTRVARNGEKSGLGEVSVAGITHKASFKIEGFDRRWDFGDESIGDPYLYSFVIDPSGRGTYYDFSGTDGKQIPPRQTFNCVSP